MDAPPIQYARTDDGVHIAYATLGEGPTLLLLQMPGICHPALEWEVPSARGFYERLAETFRVVRYAPRGTALSDDGHISLDTSAVDIIAVLDAIDAASVSLVAGEATIFHAVGVVQRHPERVACVVALGPTMTPHGGGGAIDATVAITRGMPKSQAESFARLMDPEGADSPEPLLRLLREAFAAVAATMSRRLLLAPAALTEIPSLETPLPVIDWPEADGSEGPELARRWPNARLASRPGRGHYWYDPDPGGLVLFIRDFVLAHVSPQERQTASQPTGHASPALRLSPSSSPTSNPPPRSPSLSATPRPRRSRTATTPPSGRLWPPVTAPK